MFDMKKQSLYFLIVFGSITFTVIVGFANIVGGIAYFSDRMKNAGIYGIIIVVLFSIILGLVGAGIKYWHDHIRDGHDTLPPNQPVREGAVASAMIAQVEEYAKQRNFRAAIPLGQVLSRPFWLDGQYEERIRLGEIMFEAGSAVGNKEIQMQALIDDLGWTYVALNNFDEAKKNINQGLKIAEEIKDFYMIAKANRHLGGVATKQSMFQIAEKNLLDADEAAKKITDEKSRTEMLAGIQYGLAEVYRHTGNLREAEIASKSAQKAFKEMNDSERLAKTYSLLGQIYLDKKLNMEALSTFSEGLEVSRLANRKDEIVRNLIGIAIVYISDAKTKNAKEKLEEAEKMAISIGLVAERDQARNLLQKIK